MSKRAWLIVIAVLLTASCREPGAAVLPADTQEPPFEPTMEIAQPLSVPAEDLPVAAVIDIQPSILSPGETVHLSTESTVNGRLEFTGPRGYTQQVLLSGGKGQALISPDAPSGLYYAFSTENEAALLAAFRVADGPEIWLTADRQYIQPDQQVQIQVRTYGIPETTRGRVKIFNTDTFSSASLGPGFEEETLLPISIQKQPLVSDLTNRSWLLPPGVFGTLQVVGGTSDFDQDSEYASNEIEIERCEQPSAIEGNLEGPGWVQASWTSGGLQTTRRRTQDGHFRIPAGPGTVILQTFRGDPLEDVETSSFLVDLACGEVENVGTADMTEEESIHAAYPFLGQTLEDVDLYTLQSQGAYDFSHEGYATCRMTENTFRVNFNPGADDPLVYNLEIPLLKGSGEYEGLFQIIHFLDGDFSGKAEVDIQLGELDVLNAARGSFTAELTVNGKENTITGQFTCAYTASFNQKDPDKNYALHRPPKSASLTSKSPAAGGDDICRTGFITHGEGLESVAGHWLAMTLSDHDLRMRTMTKGDLTTLLGLHGQRLLLGDDEEAVQQDIMAAAGALDTDFLFMIKIDQVDETYVFTIKVVRLRDMAVVVNEQSTGPDMEKVFFSGILDRVAQEMVNADLCGRIDPENVSLKAGETELITFHVTDLKGDPVRDAEVEFTPAECGDFDPPRGRVENGEFETEFEAGESPGVCREQLEFTATGQTDKGEVKTMGSNARLDIEVKGAWLLESTMQLGDGPDQVRITWEGNFGADENGVVLGQGTGTITGEIPNYPCLVFDFDQGEIREEPNPATLQGGFVFYVTGELEGSGADASFDFSTYGLIDHLTYQFGHEGCSRNLTYDPFTGGLITLAAENPHVFLGEKPFYLPAENDAEEQYALSVGPESVPGWMSVHLEHANPSIVE